MIMKSNTMMFKSRFIVRVFNKQHTSITFRRFLTFFWDEIAGGNIIEPDVATMNFEFK